MTFLKTYLPKLNLAVLILIAFIMPIYQKPLGLLIGVFALLTFIDASINKTFEINNKKIIITGFLFFLIHIISVLYSDNKGVAWFDIEVKLSLFIFPMLFLFKNKYLIDRKKKVLFSFVIGSLVSSILMIISAGLNYNELGSAAFYYTNICLFHPSYMAMYFTFSIAIIVKYMVINIIQKSNKRTIFIQYVLPALSILLLITIIFLLQSKAGIITTILMSLFLFVFSIIKVRSVLFRIVVPILLVSLIFVYVQKSSRLKPMVTSVETIVKTGKSSDSTTGIRFEIWKTTIKEIKSNWLIGVGAGDIKSTLYNNYADNSSNSIVKNSFNIHNQYLETFLGQGIVGILLLLAMLFLGLQEAIKRKNWLLTVFVGIIAINFGPESMLNTLAGVVFFSFFYYFLFTFSTEKDSTPITNLV